jgi:class 3 adenylate cyclase
MIPIRFRRPSITARSSGAPASIYRKSLGDSIAEFTVDSIELSAGEKAVLSVQLPGQFIIVFDPVTHGTQFLDVKGEPTRERQTLSMVFNKLKPPAGTIELRPVPLRLSLENRTDRRVIPALWIAGDRLHDLLGKRKPFLTAKRLLTNQTFRDIYRADVMDIDQRLKITSLTFLFTDLKGSTALYERVGDLVAYNIVRQHFHVLQEVVAAEAGAIVKTIGDAVMATFPTPDRAVAAALRMREEMARINAERGNDDLLLKIGIHEAPCLAVMLNDSQDYFGQTVNMAAHPGPRLLARHRGDQAGGGESRGCENSRELGPATEDAAGRATRHRRRDDGL